MGLEPCRALQRKDKVAHRKLAAGPDMPSFDAAAQIAQFAKHPWQGVTKDDLAGALAVPSMLSFEESQLYHWLGKNSAGIGATIDLGAFAGGSAARLLSGLSAGGKPHHLHAYDRFTANAKARAQHLSPGGVAMTDDDDILPLATRLLRPWVGQFTLHSGEILAQMWSGDPVETLAVDAGKTTALADHIASSFYPALVPGQSVLIHQDFLHAQQPWLCAQMQSLAACFVPLAHVAKDCVVFLCIQPVSAAALAAAATERLTDADLISAVQRAAKLYAPLIPKNRFGAMVRRIKANPGVRIAWQMRARVKG